MLTIFFTTQKYNWLTKKLVQKTIFRLSDIIFSWIALLMKRGRKIMIMIKAAKCP